MPDILVADISEFQDNIDAPTYLNAGHQIVICRVHNSARADLKMPGRRNYLRGYPFVGIGWYQYLTAGANPAQVAQAFINTIGALRANEWPILDLETGSGDQTGRAAQWFSVVDRWAGFPAMLYSGDSFLRSNLGGSGRWAGRPIWTAAYGPDDGQPHTEPSEAHMLWQFSSRWNCPGVGPCDGSIHHDTAQEFIRSVRGGHVAAAAPAPAPAAPAPAPTSPKPVGGESDVYVLACTVNGHADWIVTGEKAAVIQTQAELQGYTAAGIPVHVLPLPNYEKLCGLMGVKG